MAIAIKTATTLVDLKDAIEGQLVLPGEADWDEARRAWNLAADQQPAAVVYPDGVDDVIAVVDFARSNGLGVAVQGTGHGAVARGPLVGQILLNMGRLDGFEIDVERRTVRVEAGALWGPITDAAGEHGLAPLAGSSRDVGVVGYSLGGGLGWLGRRYGLATNSVRAIELVTADGIHKRVDHENEPELFWALRGGGGNFGVVTAMELELFPVTQVYAGWLLWPAESAENVLKLYREWVETVPDEVTSVVRILHLPPIEEIPEPLRGKSWAVIEAAFLTDESEAARLLSSLRAAEPAMDTFQAMPASGLGHLHADPAHPVPAIGHGGLLEDLTPEAIERLVGATGAGSGTTLISIEARHLGGALARPEPEHGALAALDGAFAFFAVGSPMGPVTPDALEADLDAALEAVAPCSKGRSYLNFKERQGSPRAAFDAETYERLKTVKAAYDPGNLFRANHPIAVS